MQVRQKHQVCMPLNFGSASPGASANFCCTKHKHFKIYGRHGPGMPARQRLQVCIRRKLGLELSGACAKLRFWLHSTLNLALLLRAELQVHSLKQLWCCRAAWELSGVQSGSSLEAAVQPGLQPGAAMQPRVQPGSLECSLGAATWELSCSLGAAVQLESCHAAWGPSCSLEVVMRSAVQPESCHAARGLSHSMLVLQPGSCHAECRSQWNLCSLQGRSHTSLCSRKAKML